MAVSLIIGAQWGDEGKGKIVDFLASAADYVVRFHGGNNAGHTVVNDYGKFGLHLIPSGIFSKKATAVIANGTVVDLDVFLQEVAMIQKAGINMQKKLVISPRCHIILPYHKLLDTAYEAARGKGKTGTTGRGIGPVHADKVSYNGITIGDLLDGESFKEKLHVQLLVKNKILRALGEKEVNEKETVDHFIKLKKQIEPFVTDTFSLLQNALKAKKSIMMEGAQGVFLDNDWGTYPFVTASTIVSGGITAGAGIAPQNLTKVIGVVKAYTTRVGDGPFPTELFDEIGEKLRVIGSEVGVTTGRARRCGWFDAELVRFAAKLNGFTEIIVTKLDILDGFKEIFVCTGYTLQGKPVSYQQLSAKTLGSVKPVYKRVAGWNGKTKGVKKYADLPKGAKNYLKEIEKLVGVKISFVSTGEKRDEICKIV